MDTRGSVDAKEASDPGDIFEPPNFGNKVLGKVYDIEVGAEKKWNMVLDSIKRKGNWNKVLYDIEARGCTSHLPEEEDYGDTDSHEEEESEDSWDKVLVTIKEGEPWDGEDPPPSPPSSSPSPPPPSPPPLCV